MEPTRPPAEDDDRSGRIARRIFLGNLGVATAGALAVAGLALAGKGAVAAQPSPLPAHAHAAATPSPTATARATPTSVPTDHDAVHKAVTAAFPAKTQGQGLQELPSRVVDGVREFDLTCGKIRWEVTPGQFVEAQAYNGQVPGPVIRVTEGERIRVRVKNELADSTAVHWHGQRIVNAQDGVPFITQPPIKPGETYTYEFTAAPFGSHMYHSHHNATEQVGRGMLGPLLVMPKNRSVDPAYDKDELFIFNDALGGVTINGKGFPATFPYTANLGQRIRFRFMNEGNMSHPAHLHGLTLEVFARDGYPLPQPFKCDTLNVAPGERWDAIVVADAPGAWAFHCHILAHAEGPTGMFGMVTALLVSS
ncbi:MAG: copper oxidase [Chloroflexota bacterium]|nr:copper oxidase [Chloroflexota bacterium]